MQVTRYPEDRGKVPRPPTLTRTAVGADLPRGPDPTGELTARLEAVRTAYREGRLEEAITRARDLIAHADRVQRLAFAGATAGLAVRGSAFTVLGLALAAQPGTPEGQDVRAFEQAVESFEGLDPLTGSRGDLAADRGIALAMTGRSAQAAEMLRAAIHDLGEDTPDVRRCLGVALRDLGRREEAADVLADAVTRAPLDWQARVWLAELYEELARDPDEVAQAWAAAGESLATAGRHEEAVAALARSARAVPDRGSVHARRATTLWEAGRREEALQALSLAPAESFTAADHLAAAEIYTASDAPDEAGQHLLAARRGASGDIRVLVSVGAAYLQLGRVEDSDDVAGEILQQEPANGPGWALRGMARLQLGDVGEALTALGRADELLPDEPVLLAYLGTAHRAARDLAAALSALDRALDMDDTLAWALAVRGAIHWDLGDPVAARADLERALASGEDVAWVHAYLGDILRTVGDLDGARASLERAIELDGGMAWVWASKGHVLAQREDYNGAQEAYRRALALDTELVPALTGLADALLTLEDEGDLGEADLVLRRALHLDPESSVANALLGETLRRQGNPREALSYFDAALRDRPDYAWALGSKGQALRALGSAEEAVDLLRRAAEVAPEMAWVRYELALAAIETDDLRTAQAEFTQCLRLSPEQPVHDQLLEVVRERLARGEGDAAVDDFARAAGGGTLPASVIRGVRDVLLAEGRERLARALLSALVDEDPENIEFLREYAETLRRLGRHQEAISAADQTLWLHPDDAPALRTLGRSLLALRREEDAVAAFLRAVKVSPSPADALVDLATAQASAARYPEALETINAAGAQDPANARIWTAESRLLADIGAWERARDAALRATAAADPQPSAFRALGWALEHLGRSNAGAALEAYESALSIDGDDVWALKGIANCHYVRGDEEADRVYDAVVERTRDASRWDLIALRGWCLFRRGETAAATRAYLSALPLATSTTGILFDLHLVSLSAGEEGRAEDALRRAWAGLSSQPEMRQRGILDVALADLVLAVERVPAVRDQPAARAAIERLRGRLGELPSFP